MLCLARELHVSMKLRQSALTLEWSDQWYLECPGLHCVQSCCLNSVKLPGTMHYAFHNILLKIQWCNCNICSYFNVISTTLIIWKVTKGVINDILLFTCTFYCDVVSSGNIRIYYLNTVHWILPHGNNPLYYYTFLPISDFA